MGNKQLTYPYTERNSYPLIIKLIEYYFEVIIRSEHYGANFYDKIYNIDNLEYIADSTQLYSNVYLNNIRDQLSYIENDLNAYSTDTQISHYSTCNFIKSIKTLIESFDYFVV
jgi:hypothetical protein